MNNFNISILGKLSKFRHYCNVASESFVKVSIHEPTSVATITLQRKPVNSLNLELLSELSSTLDNLETKKGLRGMILTASTENVFSSGLDILELYQPKQERLKKLWITLQDVWLKLFSSSYPTVAVINGHCLATGCLLSLCCEYRVMVKGFSIGFNETQVGLAAPLWFINSLKNVVSARDTELALTTGRVFNSTDALKIGLVDEIVANTSTGVVKGIKFFKRFNRIHPTPRHITKLGVRGKILEDFKKLRQKDLESFLLFINKPNIQKALDDYIRILKRKSQLTLQNEEDTEEM